MRTVDLRSDTVTRPTAAMTEAMRSADLGDDVFGDDPTVLRLQDEVAALLGKEAGLLVPSGTMSNLIAVRSWTEPGDEIICEVGCHIYLYEGGGYAAIAGVSVRPVPGARGILDAETVRDAVRPLASLSHFPISRLLCVENTSNRGGGSVYPQARLGELVGVARAHGLRSHLDGARIWNAAVASGRTEREIAEGFDSVSVCLSKGLGCPVGSVLVGPRSFIDRAHRFRKMLGGGMRQAGILAAAGLYALDHHRARLAEDHRRARALAEGLAAIPGCVVDVEAVETNMVYVDVGSGRMAGDVVAALREVGVLTSNTGPRTIRLVTHLDVEDAGVEQAIKTFGRVVR